MKVGNVLLLDMMMVAVSSRECDGNLNISRTVGLMTTCETVVVGTIRRALGCTGIGVERNRRKSSDWPQTLEMKIENR